MSKLPSVVRYSQMKPQGFATQYKKMIINPIMNFNTLKTNEFVRFLLNTDGFIDPYSMMLDIEIEVDPTVVGDGVLMLDGLSTSMVNEMIVTQQSTNREIERVTEYDQIGQILYDLNLNRAAQQYQQYLGGQQEFAESKYQISQRPITAVSTGSEYWVEYWGYSPFFQKEDVHGTLKFPTRTDAQAAKLDPFTHHAGKQNSYIPQFIHQYATGVQHAFTKLPGQCYASSGLLQPFGTCRDYGYTNWTNDQLRGDVSQFLSTYPQKCLFKQGSSVTEVTEGVVTRIRLQVPVLSGVCGHLIPQSAWKFIPAKALAQTQWEFRLNPYAFFSSGLKTGDEEIKRQWKINDISMTMDLWFYDPVVTGQIDAMLNGDGITMVSQDFTMGAQYNMNSPQQVQNTWILPSGVESANVLFCWILSNDYMKYPWCRKNFRLSANIRSLQLKMGADYIPPYPISGHAGNPELVDGEDEDNTDFVVALHQAAGVFLDTTRTTKINKENFSLNTRPYDSSTANAVGWTFWNELRVQGRALYAIRLDGNPYEPDVLSGMNTKARQPIELVIKAGPSNPAECTLYTMYWHDLIVNYKNGNVEVFGQK